MQPLADLAVWALCPMALIEDESLNKEETLRFISNAFRDGYVQTTGTALSSVLPPVSRFSKTGERTKKRESVLERLIAFFNRFWDITDNSPR